MAKCMLKAKFMPEEFWAKVVSCAIYLSNCSPIGNVKRSTTLRSMEWNGVKPRVDHLKVFGSISYILMCPTKKDLSLMQIQKTTKAKQEVVAMNEFSTPLPSPTPSIHETSSF
ncbi:hypothetical protein CR513_06162, partial [Mucuna pruriens]